MTWKARLDENGFIINMYNSTEISGSENDPEIPSENLNSGYVWRYISNKWTQYKDRRGEMFYDPTGFSKEVKVITNLLENPPVDWIPYDEAKFNDDNLKQRWKEIVTNRNKLLVESDWTQLPDVSLDNKEAWKVYRQSLRDITTQPDPYNIIWPSKPN